MLSEKILALMNELWNLDHKAIHSLCCSHVPCNKSLAEHETVIIKSYASNTQQEWFAIGLMGVLNALCGQEGKSIYYIIDDETGEHFGFGLADRGFL